MASFDNVLTHIFENRYGDRYYCHVLEDGVGSIEALSHYYQAMEWLEKKFLDNEDDGRKYVLTVSIYSGGLPESSSTCVLNR